MTCAHNKDDATGRDRLDGPTRKLPLLFDRVGVRRKATLKLRTRFVIDGVVFLRCAMRLGSQSLGPGLQISRSSDQKSDCYFRVGDAIHLSAQLAAHGPCLDTNHDDANFRFAFAVQHDSPDVTFKSTPRSEKLNETLEETPYRNGPEQKLRSLYLEEERKDVQNNTVIHVCTS